MTLKCKRCGNRLGRRNHTSRKKNYTGLCFECVRNPTLEEQCDAITSSNEKCKHMKYRDTNYCVIHKYMEGK